MKISLVLFTLFISGISQIVNASPLPTNQSPIKIICIGDSITQGGKINGDYTNRVPLYARLKQKGLKVDFIGTQTMGVKDSFQWPNGFDRQHEGFYGASTNEVKNELKVDLPKLQAPDIAIIDLGTNDRGKDVGKSIIRPLSNIIAQLRARNVNVKIFIVQIPGFFENLSMHYLIWQMSDDLNQSISTITNIPLYFGWDTKVDTFDGVHPNIHGQNKMAKAIFLKLKPFLPK